MALPRTVCEETPVRTIRLALAVVPLLLLTACAREEAVSLEPGVLEHTIAPAKFLPASKDLLDLGVATYRQHCVACHGPNGDGQGDAAYLLYPRPRNFTTGNHRLVSTWEGVPTDEDLFRTISRGMPGSAMPSWAHLPERTRWALVHYVKSLAETPWTISAPGSPDPPGGAEAPRAGVVEVPREPVYDRTAQARAREL